MASQKIANDLERIGDLAVNISERVISLAGMNITETPQDLEPMSGAVRGMLGRSLGALIFRNVVLAGEVLERTMWWTAIATRFSNTCWRE